MPPTLKPELAIGALAMEIMRLNVVIAKQSGKTDDEARRAALNSIQRLKDALPPAFHDAIRSEFDANFSNMLKDAG